MQRSSDQWRDQVASGQWPVASAEMEAAGQMSAEWRVAGHWASGRWPVVSWNKAAMDCFLGLDLGQRVDHTAMALVTPVVEAEGPIDYVRFVQPTVERLRVARLERLP